MAKEKNSFALSDIQNTEVTTSRKDDLWLQQKVHSMCALLLATLLNPGYRQNKCKITQKNQDKECRDDARKQETS